MLLVLRISSRGLIVFFSTGRSKLRIPKHPPSRARSLAHPPRLIFMIAIVLLSIPHIPAALLTSSSGRLVIGPFWLGAAVTVAAFSSPSWAREPPRHQLEPSAH